LPMDVNANRTINPTRIMTCDEFGMSLEPAQYGLMPNDI
jgi:hypothetical protein